MTLAALSPMDCGARVDRLRGLLEVDALLVTNLKNIRYLTGFTGSAGMLLVGADRLLFTSDGRYAAQAAEQMGAAGVDAEIEIGLPTSQRDALASAAKSSRRVGLEAGHVTWAQQMTMAGEWFTSSEVVPLLGLVERLREVKDAGEVERIEAAASIADAALAALLPSLHDGPTEAEFALALDSEMRRRGASGPSFETIVASGPNGAKPHHRPTSRVIEEGELVVLDFGALVDGYCSDMTRTVSVGEPKDPTMRRMWDVVRESQAAGVARVAAGVGGVDVDGACRDVIGAAAWGDYFVHGTGHGVGLDIHEAPAVGSTSADTLAVGNVVTVEPGVYIPPLGGVRIEDTVVVTDDGCRALTSSPKEFVA